MPGPATTGQWPVVVFFVECDLFHHFHSFSIYLSQSICHFNPFYRVEGIIVEKHWSWDSNWIGVKIKHTPPFRSITVTSHFAIFHPVHPISMAIIWGYLGLSPSLEWPRLRFKWFHGKELALFSGAELGFNSSKSQVSIQAYGIQNPFLQRLGLPIE